MGVASVLTSLVSGLLPRDGIRYKYSAVPASTEDCESPPAPHDEQLVHGNHRPRPLHEQARLLKLTAGAMILFAVLAAAAVYGYVIRRPFGVLTLDPISQAPSESLPPSFSLCAGRPILTHADARPRAPAMASLRTPGDSTRPTSRRRHPLTRPCPTAVS